MPGTRRSDPASRRTVDAPTRVCHWLLALCFFGVELGGDGEAALRLHAVLGETMGGLLVFRILWGTWGPRHARRSTPWYRLAALSDWWRGLHAGTPDWRVAQSLGLAFGTVSLLLLIGPLVLSGLASAGVWGVVHDVLGQLILVLALVHVAFVLGLSVLHRRNLVLTMVTGCTQGQGPDRGCRNHRAVAGLLLSVVLVFWGWQWHAGSEGRMDDGVATSILLGPGKSGHDGAF